MERGFVKLHRVFNDWEFFDDPKMIKLMVYLMMNVNIEPKKWNGTVIERGQMVTTIKHLSDTLKFSTQELRTRLNKLKKSGTISTNGITNRYTIITLIKWDFYQGSTKKSTNQLTNQQQTSNKPATKTKEYKNIRNKEYISSSSYIYNIPTISDVRNYIEENNLNVNADKFYNYYSQREWIVNKKRINWQLRLLDWSKTEKNNNQTMFSSQRNYTHEQLEKMTMLKLAK